MIDPRANEAALRYLVDEVTRLHLLLAQAVGNLALANARLKENQPSGAVGLSDADDPLTEQNNRPDPRPTHDRPDRDSRHGVGGD